MNKCISTYSLLVKVVVPLFLGIFLCSFAVLVNLLQPSRMYLLSFCEGLSDVCEL